jgi:hypothetical protein
MKITSVAAALILAGAALGGAGSGDGWTVLFDGKGTDEWRIYMKDRFPESGWTVEPDGSLRVHAGARPGDLITRKQFADFELTFDFKLGQGANSGILYRFPEIPGKPAYHNAFEFQLIDDLGHKDGALPSHRVASLYDLYATQGAAPKPIGEWNEARIVAKGSNLEHWLNGKRVVAVDLKSADYKDRLGKSKFATWEGFGVHAKGHIALQDHGDDVWFRNIRIREIR